jgi:predicted RNase H-like nuclease (RuvC/YqgF family)
MDYNIILNALIAGISTLTGYFFGSRKSNAETDRIVIENVKEILGVYSTTINDLKIEIQELKEKITTYEHHIEKLQRELNDFRKQMNCDVK